MKKKLIVILIIVAMIFLGGIYFLSKSIKIEMSPKSFFKPPKNNLQEIPPNLLKLNYKGRATPITECGGIEGGGYYYLANDIYYEFNGICMVILEMNEPVTIECNNHRFINVGDPEVASGIDVISGSESVVIIKNCYFKDWFQPLSLRTSGSKSINNIFYNNYYGIVVGSEYEPREIIDIEIKNNTIYDTFSNELVFHGVSQADVTNNSICNAPPGGYYGPYNVYCHEDSLEGVIGNSKFSTSNCPHIQRRLCALEFMR